MPRRSRSSTPGVVYLDAGLHSVVSILLRKVRGYQVSYLRARSPREERVIRGLGAHRVDISAVKHFDVGSRSTEGPMERALPRLDRPDVDRVIRQVSRRHQTPQAEAILKSAVIAAVARHSLDAFYVEAWARSLGWTKTSFVICAHWQRLLLEGQGHSVSGRIDAVFAAALDACRYVAIKVAKALARSRNGDSPTMHNNQAAWLPNPEAKGPVLFVLNKGLTYGGLYSYDHLLDRAPDSVLSVDRVVTMAATGGESNPEGIVWAYPALGSIATRAWAQLRLFAACVWTAGFASWSTSWLLSGVSVRAEMRAHWLSRNLPDVRVALLAYDLQVPVDFVLALESSGVKTVALNERPLSVVIRTQPLAVNTLLTASSWFSDKARQSPSAAVRRAIAVGMWRTDLLRHYVGEEPHPFVARARSEGRSVIVALPYHLGDEASANPLATSVPCVRHFLKDILVIAERRSDTVMVIRGKDASWLEHEAFTDVALRLEEMSNVIVSDEYGQLNESYRLVSGADLVIAKYTSLVDEALAVGIPCLVHDYTPTARGVARPVVTYLPDEVWVENDHDLQVRVNEVLADGGRSFRARWEPRRHDLFGDVADGRVAQRARQEILELVLSTQLEKR